MPLLRSLPDINKGTEPKGKTDISGNSRQTGETWMKLIKEMQALLFSLLDIFAYRVTFR
jgi:hypothetical protein